MVSTASVALDKLNRRGISDADIKKFYALGWGQRLSDLSGIGAKYQKALDTLYQDDYPTQGFLLYTIVFELYKEQIHGGTLTAQYREYPRLLDMLNIPTSEADYAEIRRLEGEMLELLPPRDAEVLKLRFTDRLKPGKIAKKLRLSTGTIMSKIGKSLRTIEGSKLFSEMARMVFAPSYFEHIGTPRKLAKMADYAELKPSEMARFNKLFPPDRNSAEARAIYLSNLQRS